MSDPLDDIITKAASRSLRKLQSYPEWLLRATGARSLDGPCNVVLALLNDGDVDVDRIVWWEGNPPLDYKVPIDGGIATYDQLDSAACFVLVERGNLYLRRALIGEGEIPDDATRPLIQDPDGSVPFYVAFYTRNEEP